MAQLELTSVYDTRASDEPERLVARRCLTPVLATLYRNEPSCVTCGE